MKEVFTATKFSDKLIEINKLEGEEERYSNKEQPESPDFLRPHHWYCTQFECTLPVQILGLSTTLLYGQS